MDIESFREFCLSLPAVTEGLPFGEDTLVFKVEGKMFALINLNKPNSFNVKCNPEKAIELREKYDCVKEGYHMNKKHWNTIYFGGIYTEFETSLTQRQLKHWIRHSYELVVSKLPKKTREVIQRELENMQSENDQ
ncbi:MmcQ/YjbR family DNA-binding protein [Bernardetia sp.]|uniref:MmcQ/YjbR family DNA-binding protein n=1 Tax=Bernardetia sp. TaxID=1937974 RepID=UPI0025B903A2|nr:MmcQ/YjbR family DNA-binding protein [Bernardetia sp.]